jgi:predicted Ser/Thr protein kinase
MPDPITAEFLSLQEVLAGRYSIERELGRGGMGIVLLAHDVALDRLVAIKLLPQQLAEDPEIRERFLREARTAAGLSHPNIVPIHLVEAHGDLVFFVMGYVDGETLRQRVERLGPLSPKFVTRVMQEAAWALAYAHQRGIVHRDVKPDNIMIERETDRVLVTDFGIAQVTKGAPAAQSGEIIGTARYMSPEQACGEPVDGRSDLYSLSATAFFALTGRAPYEGRSLPAIISEQLTRPVPDVCAARPEVPERLGQLIGRCLAREPAGRVQTGDELATLAGELRGHELRAPPVLRRFMRNAEISTAVILASTAAIQFGNQAHGGVNLIFLAIVVQLVSSARRLLREGYSFEDIRAALLAEARLQEEESEAIKERRLMRRLMGLWHRLWAGRFGRTFFRVAGVGVKKPKRAALPGREATELILGRAATEAFDALPEPTRAQLRGVRGVIQLLEDRAEALRAGGDTGARLTEAVAALENIRVGLLRLHAGAGSVGDITQHIARAKEIGEQIDIAVGAQDEVREALR